MKPCKKSSVPKLKTVLQKLKENSLQGKSKAHFCQDLIPLQNLNYGMIHTPDDRYVKILEILPINFSNQPIENQNAIAADFSSFFYNCNKKHQIKIITDYFNPESLIKNYKMVAKNETNQLRLKTLNNYIKKIRHLSANGSISSRFFIIYEYEPAEEEKKSTNLRDIYENMMLYRKKIADALLLCGNFVVDAADYNFELGEILYKLLNRKSSQKESLQQRIDRLSTDIHLYALNNQDDYAIDDLDCISQRGTDFKGTWWYISDGEYYTHLTIRENYYPKNMIAGWLMTILPGADYDIDIFLEKRNHTLTKFSTFNLYQNTEILLKRSRIPMRVANLQKKYETQKRICESLNDGSDLFDCCVVFTMRSNSLKQLSAKKRTLLSKFSQFSIQCESAYGDCREYFQMTLPLCNFKNSIFARNSRNFLTEDLASIYCFTSYEFMDKDGFVLGTNLDTKSLIGLNPSNTQKFPACHMLLLGGTGSGKTYAQLLLAEGESFIGNRVFMILPYKAYEYYTGVIALGGKYINMADPQNCLNFWEIRPEGLPDKAKLDADFVLKKTNLLSKKIMDMTVFYSMLMKNGSLSSTEESLMNVYIKKMYSKFGITDDSNSIYENKDSGVLKVMPTFSDFLKEIKDEPRLARITNETQTFTAGTYSYLDGQTNVDLSGNILAFDVDKNNIDKKILPSMIYMVFRLIYSTCTANLYSMDTIIIDEAWYLLLYKVCGDMVDEMLKIIRGYGAHAILALQNLSDLLKTEFADSVLNMTKIKFILKSEDTKVLEERLNITANDSNFLQRCSRGTGLMLTSGETMHIHFDGSNYETMIFTSDLNVRKEIVAKFMDPKSTTNDKTVR